MHLSRECGAEDREAGILLLVSHTIHSNVSDAGGGGGAAGAGWPRWLPGTLTRYSEQGKCTCTWRAGVAVQHRLQL